MIRLSDYLNYLNREVVQARKMADIQAIKIAKEYSNHEYLRYFRVPRFSIPVVKLHIPVKINELDIEKRYKSKGDYDTFLTEVNKIIARINNEMGLEIKPITTEKFLDSKDIVSLFERFQSTDYEPVENVEDYLFQKDIYHATDLLLEMIEVSTPQGQEVKEAEKIKYTKLLREEFANIFSLARSDLNNIFIDPDTSKESDKGKILLTLDVEMVEEGIRIRSLKDKDGTSLEEIVFE